MSHPNSVVEIFSFKKAHFLIHSNLIGSDDPIDGLEEGRAF